MTTKKITSAIIATLFAENDGSFSLFKGKMKELGYECNSTWKALDLSAKKAYLRLLLVALENTEENVNAAKQAFSAYWLELTGASRTFTDLELGMVEGMVMENKKLDGHYAFVVKSGTAFRRALQAVGAGLKSVEILEKQIDTVQEQVDKLETTKSKKSAKKTAKKTVPIELIVKLMSGSEAERDEARNAITELLGEAA